MSKVNQNRQHSFRSKTAQQSTHTPDAGTLRIKQISTPFHFSSWTALPSPPQRRSAQSIERFLAVHKEKQLKSTTWHRIITAITIIIILQVVCGQQYTRVSLDRYSMGPNFTDGDTFGIAEVSLTELK